MGKSEYRENIDFYRKNSSRMSKEEIAKVSNFNKGYFTWITGGIVVGSLSSILAGRYGLNQIESKSMRSVGRFLILAIPVTIAHDYYIDKRAMPFLRELKMKYSRPQQGIEEFETPSKFD